ncbi:hypothetical protein OH77DRAFT_1516533 [Trametes cingulata]|nr:hypothetical protein OH77DRAFT_1516533 [Trametes cingulata]
MDCHQQAACDDDPPNYVESSEFVPMTPSQNDRYDRPALVSIEYSTIPRGLHSSISLPEPPYMPAGWSARINPEGSLYHINSALHIVTDLPLHCSELLHFWAKRLVAQVLALGITLPEDYECYINPDEDGKTCRYYFVDHLNQTVFWLDDVDPYRHDIDLAPTSSVAHLKFALQEQYWRHCEYFPHHDVSVALKEELINIFTQARVDVLTSSLSTFPYNAEECKQYLELLRIDSRSSEYSNWIFARLWATISKHRYNTFYGEDYAKISRDQSRLEKPAPQYDVNMERISLLLFNMPQQRAEELRLLFVDELAFGVHWRAYAATLLKDWKESCIIAIGLTIINSVMALRPTNLVSACFGCVSMTLVLASLASGALLLHRYSGADGYKASTVADHLSTIEHPTLGFQPAAALHSLPRALALWSIIFLLAHVLTTFVDVKTMIVQAPATALALAIVFGLAKADMILRHGFST